jgi:hypothetical protein
MLLELLFLAKDMDGVDIPDDEKMTPNQGIRRSAMYAISMSGCISIVGGLAVGGMTSLQTSWPLGVSRGFPLVLAIGIFMFLFFGGEAYLKHYLLRFMLYRLGRCPGATCAVSPTKLKFARYTLRCCRCGRWSSVAYAQL